jgi:4-amino-4-deoxy-L-arabinose transferase-like glycosyltransferase
VHAAVWTLAAWLSRGNLDLAGDMVENYVWGIEWQAGYAKHPPLFAWVTAAWFSVMPRAEWAYYALSALNAALGLAGVAALAARFVTRERAVVAALVLAVSPLYTGLAIKFNANAVLLAVWPWAASFFVAHMQEGRLRDAAACGALTALALLGKYFSVVLALAFVLAAVAVPAWRARLRGAGPWVALGAAALVLAPHLAWLAEHQFLTLRYASQRSDGQFGAGLLRLLNYSAAQVGYLLPGALLLVWAAAPGRRREAAVAMLRSLVQPAQQTALWWLAFAPMLVIAVIAVLARTPMASVWGMAQWFALPALWLAALNASGLAPRADALRRALIVYWVTVPLLAAGVGYVDARRAAPAAAEPRAELAHAVHRLWREHAHRPLAITAGDDPLTRSLGFYSDARTRWWNPIAPVTTPWLTHADWQREGGVMVCADADRACNDAAQRLVATAPTPLAVRKQAWGMALPEYRYRVYLQPPA